MDISSCCGMDCSACEYYPADCPGCPAVEGRVFWLVYVGGDVCPLYHCCVRDNGYTHCGECPALPCSHYTEGDGDPTRSPEENDSILAGQLVRLKQRMI